MEEKQDGQLRADVLGSDHTEGDPDEERMVSGVTVELSPEGVRAHRADPKNSAYQGNRVDPHMNVTGYTGAYHTGYGTYANPQEIFQKNLEQKKHRGLAIASVVLSGISVTSFMMYGLAIIPAVIGTVFGLIAWIGGKYSTRTMGIVGFFTGLAGIALNTVMLVMIIGAIRWENVTLYNIGTIQNVDPNDPQSITEWFRQFIRN